MGEKTTGENTEVNEAPAKELSFREALAETMRADEAKAPEISDKEPAQKAPELADKEPAKTVKEIPPPVLPPADMTAKEKEIFAKADPEMQAYLSRRAYDVRATISREMQKVQDIIRSNEGILKAIEPHREYLAKKGLTPDVTLSRAIAWEQAIERDRLGAAKEWLNAQGIDPYELISDEGGQQPPAQQSHQQIDPEAIKQQVLEEVQRKYELERQNAATESNLNAVNNFMKSKVLFRDPNTAAQLEAEMALEIPVERHKNPNLSQAELLERAYNKVIRTNDTFSKLLEAYGARESAEKVKQEAEKARQSSRSISGGIAGASPARSDLTFRDELRLRLNGGM